MDNKRRFRRFSVDILGINGKMVFANEVEIIDISIGGVSLKVDRRLNIDSEYVLKLGNTDQSISVKGSVVWSKITGTKKGSRNDVIPIYSAGMRFSDAVEDKAEAIARFIERVALCRQEEAQKLNGLRLSMRFPTREPEKAVLDMSQNYLVKKLSQGGMLIQSGYSFGIGGMFPMEIFLPGGRQIGFIGRIASCFEVSGTDPSRRYDVGIEFSEMKKDDSSALKEFIFVLDKTGNSR